MKPGCTCKFKAKDKFLPTPGQASFPPHLASNITFYFTIIYRYFVSFSTQFRITFVSPLVGTN